MAQIEYNCQNSDIKTIKEENIKSKFIGKNFVFDHRLGERITDDIISQCQVKFVHIADFTCDRSDRIMRLAVCLCKNKCRFIGVSSPYFQHMSRKIHQTVRIFVTDTEYR